LVSRGAAQKFDVQKLNNAEVKNSISSKSLMDFAALENLVDNVNINMAWENM
jgi:hypothetical protein